ncbi:MAG TPA: sensor domain-containing diguanylate cyclase [Treponemataceae bacterium]|nr:sensor domain-containing diguanylate cyclase [Treponemataceae bacterium]HPS42922.1 sensor domain-containing diguanylate cyclase [Treponemataceae bacterium]
MKISRLSKTYLPERAARTREWERVVFSPKFSCSYALLGDRVLVVRGHGFSTEDTERASLAFGERILDANVSPDKSYVIIQDWCDYRNSTAEARKLFMDFVIGNRRLALLIFCNCTFTQSLSIKLGRALGFLRTSVLVCQSYHAAKSAAFGFLETGIVPPERSAFLRFMRSRANQYTEDLLAYLESIDWETGKKRESIEPDVRNPLLPVFDTITVIRSGLEQTFQERDRAETELRDYQRNLQTLVQERTAALEKSERRYRLLLELSPSPIAITTETLSVEYVNQAYTALFGYNLASDESATNGKGLLGALCPTEETEAAFRTFVADRASGKQDFELKTRWGGTVFAQVSRNALDNAVILSFTDITDRKKVESRLFELSLTDELTGIYNRRHFVSVLSREMQQFARYRTALSLVIFDIDHFKAINDTYGHPAGDAVLRELTARIATQIREIDFFFRIGGEEFALVMPNTEEEPAAVVAERLREEIDSREFSIEAGSIHVSISLGLAQATDIIDTPETLFREADALLFRAKNEGRNRLVHA